MGNNNNRNNGNNQNRQQQQAQQGQQQEPKQEGPLDLDNANLDGGADLGVLQAAPIDQANGDNNVTGDESVKGDANVQNDANANSDSTSSEDAQANVTGDASRGEYVPPEQQNTAPVEPPAPAQVTETQGDVVIPPSLEVPHETPNDEASLEEDPAKVLVSEMVTADGTAVTTIMLRRLEKHMKFVRGTLAFRDSSERFDEQVTWIDTVGNSLNLDYPQYVLVTKAILAEILKDVDLFREGGAYRFLQSVKGKIPASAVEGYEAYFTFLTRVAANWKTRHRLRSSIDIAFPVSRIPTAKGKENLTKFFSSLVK